MNNWNKYKLSDILEIIGGGTPKTSIKEYWNGDISWISVKDFNNNSKYIFCTEKTITEQGVKKSSTKFLNKGDLIISARGTVGELAVLSKKMTFNQSCYGLRAKECTFNDFLYYIVKHSIYKLKSQTHGSVFDTITKETFNNIDILLPSIDEQKKISSILSSIDDKIELNSRINKNLEQQAFTLFRKMFPDITIKEKMIGDFIIPKRGKNLLSKNTSFGNIPVVAGGLEPSTYHNVSNTKAPVITISASGANSGYVRLWNIPVWSSDSSFIDSSMTKDVYFWYVMLKKRQKEIYDSQTGSAQPHIYPQHIAIMPINNIDPFSIDIFTNAVTPLFQKIGTNIKENESLTSIRDNLLPKLLSGELDVSSINLDI